MITMLDCICALCPILFSVFFSEEMNSNVMSTSQRTQTKTARARRGNMEQNKWKCRNDGDDSNDINFILYYGHTCDRTTYEVYVYCAGHFSSSSSFLFSFFFVFFFS